MTTYNTGAPVPSVDVRDLYDNSENLDYLSAGTADSYLDRLGVSRKSWAGMESNFQASQSSRDSEWTAFLLASGYQVLGAYAAGLEFTSYNQTFSYGGEFYAPSASITLPYTTTGVGAAEIANFRPVGDAILRSDLANSADPAEGAALVGFSSETVYSALTRALAGNTLDTVRIDVASASTVNLTSAAPSTRHINITGTTTINGFTAVAGMTYFVRFDSGLTLTNNASIVTQTGANILTAAGDTCIIRATAANVVEVMAYTSVGSLDSSRVDVASAAWVNLTTSAPNTRHINITGTSTINGFTVAAGQCYFVCFNAALTLTNGAGLVTNRNGDIKVAAGDTCIIRATSANVIEVLCGEFLIDRGVGSGQAWQGVTRTSGTNYTNTSGRTIHLMATASLTPAQSIIITCNGFSVAAASNGGTGAATFYVSAPIPNGNTYSVTAYASFNARELR